MQIKHPVDNLRLKVHRSKSKNNAFIQFQSQSLSLSLSHPSLHVAALRFQDTPQPSAIDGRGPNPKHTKSVIIKDT